jgi:hypothetical protein
MGMGIDGTQAVHLTVSRLKPKFFPSCYIGNSKLHARHHIETRRATSSPHLRRLHAELDHLSATSSLIRGAFRADY